MTELLELTLEDRYTRTDGPALMTGTQALVRLLIEQRALDERRGLRTGAFVSGYPGSPLGGLDREIQRSLRHLEPVGVVFQPGINEELAATAVAGTQLVPELPHRRLDGVVGWWYGKAPGLDRAADAIRHGNVSGTTHLGGAVALVGDDPFCKSSTLPSSCELMAESLMLPMLAPAAVEDIIRLGLHAVALSRAAGSWAALKVVSDVADASARVDVAAIAAEIPLPPTESRGPAPVLLGASAVAAEHDLMSERLDRAREYGRAHGLNRVVFEPARPRTALVAPGPAFATLRRALDWLGLGERELDESGIRLVRLELVWPIHPHDARAFAAGVDEILVVEDKRPFVERQLRDLLYAQPDAPVIVGKRDREGRPLIPMAGAVESDALARALGRHWQDRLPRVVGERLERATAQRRNAPAPLPVVRTPFFCSGCPHNLSTKAPADQLVGAGIGCHSLVALDPSAQRGNLLGAPQMGGEGAQWIGMAPFTADPHYLQNLGDGTFHHSGSLAIRAAVASGVNITFRLLYNDAIAMTGGQTPPGRIGIEALTHWLELEGVARVVITSEAPAGFDRGALAATASVRHRDELPEVHAELAEVEGVTVVIHSDRCATEERRLRKRGKLAAPAQRVWINERVCEGCGDCGRKSSCLSVVPVDTEFGRKTQVHQSSCTQDFACVEGDCPSFVMVTPKDGRLPTPAPAPPLPVTLRDPPPRFDPRAGVLVRMPGVGGTGVVTVSQILQMAALLDGMWASGLDQTGLAQKGGAVISDIRIGIDPDAGSLRAAAGEVDVLLGLDPIGAVAADTLRTLDPDRTIAVVNRQAPATAAMVTDPRAGTLDIAAVAGRIEAATGAALWIPAGSLSERLFSDHMAANVIMLGAAFQHGCLPLSEDALRRAIELNGGPAEQNLTAFSWGRAAALDLAAVEAALLSAPAPRPGRAEIATWLDDRPLDDTLRDLVLRLASDLVDYQSRAYARAYVDDVLEVVAVAQDRVATVDAVAVARNYARGLHKLLAYKDEYEVARLHLDAFERARREAVFGRGARVEVLLHPPLLRALGLERKLRLRRTAVPLFRILRAARGVRGTPFDPFGRAALRRLERELADEYRSVVRAALQRLEPATADAVARIAALPDGIRGYEDIKLANVRTFRDACARELAGLGTTSARAPEPADAGVADR